MSETPRTDLEAAKSAGDYYMEDTVPVEFSRQLEREHAEALALLRELNDALLPIPDALQARVDAVLDKADA